MFTLNSFQFEYTTGYVFFFKSFERLVVVHNCLYKLYYLRVLKLNIIDKHLIIGTCDRSVIFSGPSTNKSDRHDATEILFKVA